MKIALVHDWLNSRVGGSERLFIELANLYPDAPIYTLLYRPDYYRGLIDPKRVRSSSLSRLPRALTDRPRYLLPLIPAAIEQFDFSGFDIVISSSNAFSKSILTSPATTHISYCNSPMRFAWDYWPRYLDEQNIGSIKRFFASRMISKIRLWDYYSSKRVDHWVANSQHVAARIKKYYGADSQVIYPPVQIDQFEPSTKRSDYYVTLATLTPYKQVDRAIAACNQLKRRLVVIGDGYERPRLEALAGSTIEFAGSVDDQTKAGLLNQAKGLLVPQEEDFGIAMVEALAAGAPVIAYGVGGACEIVSDGLGVLYADNSTDGLMAAIKQAETHKFDSEKLRRRARDFSVQNFSKHITRLVDNYEKSYSKA